MLTTLNKLSTYVKTPCYPSNQLFQTSRKKGFSRVGGIGMIDHLLDRVHVSPRRGIMTTRLLMTLSLVQEEEVTFGS